MPSESATTSFNIEGELKMGFFAGQKDACCVRINDEKIAGIIARMFGFPNEEEFDRALQSGVSSDSDQPDIVRSMGKVSISVYMQDQCCG